MRLRRHEPPSVRFCPRVVAPSNHWPPAFIPSATVSSKRHSEGDDETERQQEAKETERLHRDAEVAVHSGASLVAAGSKDCVTVSASLFG